MPEESYSFVLDSLEAMANHQPDFEREISSLTLDGKKLTVLYRWVIPPEQADTYSTVIASIVDVTSRKEVEDALQNYSERFRGLHELDLAINVKKSPKEISAVALEFVAQFIPTSGAEIWGLDETRQIVTLLAIVHSEDDGERPFHPSPNLQSELGDTLYTLCHLAASTGVDLEDAFTATLAKYETRWHSKGHIGSPEAASPKLKNLE